MTQLEEMAMDRMVAHAAPLMPMPIQKMKMGSRMMFMTAPRTMTPMAARESPSARIRLLPPKLTCWKMFPHRIICR